MIGRTPVLLINSRQKGDQPADRLTKEVFGEKEGKLKEDINSVINNASLISLSGKNEHLDLLIRQMKLPDWADKQKMDRGRDIFHTYTLPILGLLGLYSLPYCYAAANGAKVLIHSKNILERPQKRLSETARFVTDIFSRDSFDETGKGFASIFKVRLMHAVARYFSSRHIREEVPVNQEDLAGTNLAFSIICLRGLQKSGIELSRKEWEAYIHFWNVVGHLLGIDDALLPDSISSAAKLERDIRNHQFTYSFEGEKLTRSLIDMLNKQNEFKSLIGAADLLYYFMGQEVASFVGLNRATPITSALLSALKVRNFLYDYSKTRYDSIVKLIENQVKLADGSYFTI